MSWDVLVVNFAGKTPPANEMADEPPAVPLGPAAKVRNDITAKLPGVDWSDPTWGIYEGETFSIEFNIGKDDPLESIMLHVRGGGAAIPAMMAFAKPLGWSLLDCSTSEYLDPENPSSEGWEGFQDYRDKVMRAVERKKPIGKAKKPKSKGKKPTGKKEKSKRKEKPKSKRNSRKA